MQPEVAYNGIGFKVGEQGIIVYNDGGRIMGVVIIWVKKIFGDVVSLFE